MNTTKHLGFIFPTFRKEVLARMEKDRAAAMKIAVALARKDLPALDAPTPDPMFTSAAAAYNQHYAERIAFIKPDVHRENHERTVADSTKRIKEIDDQTEILLRENDTDRRELDGQVAPAPVKRNFIGIIILAILTIVEIFWAEAAFEALGDAPYASFIAALGITAVQGLIAIRIGKNMHRLAKEGKRMDMKTAGLIAILVGIVISLTVMRSYALKAMESNMPAWVYLFVHVALIAGTVLSSKQAFPSQEERDEERQRRERFKKISDREAECAALDREKSEIEKTVQKSEEDLGIIESEVRDVRLIMRAHFHETVAKCKTENQLARGDNGVPRSFTLPAPKLEFESANETQLV